MNTLPLRTYWQLLLSFPVLLGTQSLSAATFSVSPPAASNTYSGYLTFSAGGLTNGETVVVEKFLDLNTNGVVDAGDLLTQSFQLTDGQATVIGGVTNINVPGDLDSPNGTITARLYFRRDGSESLAGKYAFKLSSPSSRFTSITNLFTITNLPHAQTVSGIVRSSGTNVPYAGVLLLSQASGNRKLIGGTVADSAGNYTIKVPTGSYLLTAFKSNYVADFSSPIVTLGAGGSISTNVNMVSATNTITGKIVDAGNNSIGLPGVFVTMTSTNNFLGIAFTDTNGNFNVPATASQWRFSPSGPQFDVHGYLGLNNSIKYETSTGNVAGVTVALPKATAFLYGSIRDEQNNPVAGLIMQANDNTYSSGGMTDANGNYVVGAAAGNWSINASSSVNFVMGFANYIFPNGVNTSLSGGQAVQVNFIVKSATNIITGSVRNSTNGPVAGVSVFAFATINGTNYQTYSVSTDANGNYSMSVANGNWTVSVVCNGGSGSLSSLGYLCANSKVAYILNSNSVVDFTVLPVGVLSFAVSPQVVSSEYNDFVTFYVGGLTNGEPVVIERFLDANGNGVIGPGEQMVQSFRLTDGTASVIGGATNINVPSDLDGSANGAITAPVNFQSSGDLSRFAGKYAYKLSSPFGRFTPITNLFTITNVNYAQGFTGTVRSSGTNVPYAGVFLLAFSPDGDSDLVGGTFADASGNYSIKAKPNVYLVASGQSNYVTQFTGPVVALGAGATINTNLTLIFATNSISGKIVDAGNTNKGVPGISMPIQSEEGFLTVTYTDTNGNFSVPVTAGNWNFRPQGTDLTFHGYLTPGNKTYVNTTTGSVAGVIVPVEKAVALVYGTIFDEQGLPVAGVHFYSQDQNGMTDGVDTYSNPYGVYAAGLTTGDWNSSLDNNNPALANYVVSGGSGTVNFANGQALRQDYTTRAAPYHITGHVKNNNNNPVEGVYVYANDNNSGFRALGTTTDANGNYSINVANGNWSVGLNCQYGDDSLSSLGYQCVNDQFINITNANGTADFTVQPCAGVQILTTSLPNGSIEAFYSTQLNASSCAGSINWSLSPGSQPLPPGLGLSSNGTLSGNPTTPGNYSFSVRADDGNGHADQALSVNISPTLHIITTSLPSGTQGTMYNLFITATNGLPPYSWDLAPGSLSPPSGLTFYSDGRLAGTPDTSGTVNFTVRVTDSSTHFEDQALSLTINSSAPPLQITTTSLPNGTVGTSYNQQLNASGGQPSYSWTMTPGSAALPANLSLASNGIISGTPVTNGTFFFFVRVTDAAFTVVDQSLSITLNLAPLQITNSSLPNGTVSGGYTNKVGATGGLPPYSFSLAQGSAPLPPGLSIATNGTISGVATSSGLFNFIMRVTDANSTSATRPLSITINPRPGISSPTRLSASQFRLTVNGTAGQNYTIQYSTNLTTWNPVLVTNPSGSTFTVTDSSATNSRRYYRVLVGP